MILIYLSMNVYYKYTNIYIVIDKFKKRALVYVNCIYHTTYVLSLPSKLDVIWTKNEYF